MPRPRKYANNAEKAKAFRLRRKLKNGGRSPGLDEVAQSLHKRYQDWAKFGLIDAEKQIGKTPQETLLRAIVYDVLWEQYVHVDVDCELPPLEELLETYQAAESDLKGYFISRQAIEDALVKYAGHGLDEDAHEDEEDEEEDKA
jgi:hypothetical protein